MILRLPDYCGEFRCSAGKCSDSCCIGWEIDIDDKTADYYMSLDGQFGERLKKGISHNDVYSFALQNERCPFLNEDNLCDIILNLGEDKLCHICAEHPRYYEWFSGVKEGGVGLCCEEAARLVLEKGMTEGYIEREVPNEDCEEYEEELYAFLFEAREKIFSLFRNKSVPFADCVTRILAYADKIQEQLDNYSYGEVPEIAAVTEYKKSVPDVKAILKIFGALEPIDEKWKPFVVGVSKNSDKYSYNPKYEPYLRSAAIYFVWRYFMKGVFDEEILSKIRLAVISAAMLSVLFQLTGADFEQCVMLAKNYSKETEYSEENLEAIYDMCYTEEVFSAEELIKFF